MSVVIHPRWPALALCLTGLGACAVGPNYLRPTPPPQASYGVDEALAPKVVTGMQVPSRWWEAFGSADLNALVVQALAESPTIGAAQAALRAAREQVKAQKSAYFPTVAASIQPTRQRFAQTLSSPLQSGNELYSLTTTQVTVAYTPDLFGANRRAVESLVAQEDQQRFELEAARVTLATNIVVAAIQDALLRAEIATTEDIISEQQKTLTSFQSQYQLGQISKVDLVAQQALLAQSRATLPPLQKQRRINRDLLSALIGRTPGEPLAATFEFASLHLPETLPLSLPAKIVEQRPDVRIAEAQLHSASAEIGVAAAARWPNLQIDASAGAAAIGLTPAFNNAANFWSVGATLTQPLFDAGALRHRQRSAEALFDQSRNQYRGVVVAAFQNTADVLHALAADADAETLATVAQEASDQNLIAATRQYALGDVSRLAVLSAEQVSRQARLTSLQAHANRLEDAAALFQALGGGWWNNEGVIASAAGFRPSAQTSP